MIDLFDDLPISEVGDVSNMDTDNMCNDNFAGANMSDVAPHDISFGASLADSPTLFDASIRLNDFADNNPDSLIGHFSARMANLLTGENSLEMSSIHDAVQHSSDFFNTMAPHIYDANDLAHFRWNGDGDYMIGGNQELLDMAKIGDHDSVEFIFAHEFTHFMQYFNPIEGISDNPKLNEMTSDFCAAFKSGAEGLSVDAVKDFMAQTGQNSNYPDGDVRAQIIELGHTLGGKYVWQDFQSVSDDIGFSYNKITEIIYEFKNIDESLWSMKATELQNIADNLQSISF